MLDCKTANGHRNIFFFFFSHALLHNELIVQGNLSKTATGGPVAAGLGRELAALYKQIAMFCRYGGQGSWMF